MKPGRTSIATLELKATGPLLKTNGIGDRAESLRGVRVDESTANVEILTGFIFDVLHEYRDMKSTYAPIFRMAEGLDAQDPDAWCPIELYNGICNWVEQQVGSESVRKAGNAIGGRAFDSMVQGGKLSNPTPLAMMEALQWAAATMIRDPKGRGWEILNSSDGLIRVRRTQTFNCTLQEGLLLSLLQRVGVTGSTVRHATCVRRDAPYCEYILSWTQ